MIRKTQTMNASDARQHWATTLDRVSRRRERVVVEKSGVPVAAIVSIDDLERLNGLDDDREDQFRVIDETRALFRDVPDAELEAEILAAIDAVRSTNSGR